MMKKTEANTSGKAKKTTKAAKTVKSNSGTKGIAAKSSTGTKGKAVKSKKVKALKPELTIEEISTKAYEIYNARISRGEPGTQADDWFKAVELLKKG